MEVQGRDSFPTIPPMRAFALIKKDKEGRGNFFCEIAHFTPATTNTAEIEKFGAYVLNLMSASMPANLDQFNIFFDCRGIGRANV